MNVTHGLGLSFLLRRHRRARGFGLFRAFRAGSATEFRFCHSPIFFFFRGNPSLKVLKEQILLVSCTCYFGCYRCGADAGAGRGCCCRNAHERYLRRYHPGDHPKRPHSEHGTSPKRLAAASLCLDRTQAAGCRHSSVNEPPPHHRTPPHKQEHTLPYVQLLAPTTFHHHRYHDHRSPPTS